VENWAFYNTFERIVFTIGIIALTVLIGVGLGFLRVVIEEMLEKREYKKKEKPMPKRFDWKI